MATGQDLGRLVSLGPLAAKFWPGRLGQPANRDGAVRGADLEPPRRGCPHSLAAHKAFDAATPRRMSLGA
jgi:hypothetical protein